MISFKEYIKITEGDENVLYDALYQNIPKDVYKSIVKNDPESKKDEKGFVIKVDKLSKWMLDLWKKFKFNIKDENKLKIVYDSLDFYEKHRKDLTGDLEQYKNLKNIKNIDELIDITKRIEDYLQSRDNISKGQIKQGEKDIEIIFENEKWKILIPLTFAASVKWGHNCNNAKWCASSTSSKWSYDYYNSIDYLYIFYNKKNPVNSYKAFIESPNKIQFTNTENLENNSTDVFYKFIKDEDLEQVVKDKLFFHAKKLAMNPDYQNEFLLKRIKETSSIYILMVAVMITKPLEVFKELVDNFKGDLNQVIKNPVSVNPDKFEYFTILDLTLKYNADKFEYLWSKGIRVFYDKEDALDKEKKMRYKEVENFLQKT